MEDKFDLLKYLKKFQNQETILMENLIYGLIIDIEEIEYNRFRLTLKINETIYNGIYIDMNKSEEIDLIKGYKILLTRFKLIKKERNIYIYISSVFTSKVEDEEDLNDIKNANIVDLNPNSLINTIKGKSDIIYSSDIFIYKRNELHILSSIKNNEEFILGKNLFDTEAKDFIRFLSEKNIKTNDLIVIDNFILTKEKIEFNNLTLFNIVTLEYIDEYFRKKFNKYNENIFSNNEDEKVIKYQKLPLNQDNLLT